ncbi:hypothetical protein DPMN_117859 [Dreissena polymorpha]|uniref:Uncharacterized protein n=1 Tax=Dreissena polymorpha TaxID=45954 RepID=A0A9D4GJ31_DREPO|nr:hypothetical protein DPMN_117859 [Dreissena polymorpha]
MYTKCLTQAAKFKQFMPIHAIRQTELTKKRKIEERKLHPPDEGFEEEKPRYHGIYSKRYPPEP